MNFVWLLGTVRRIYIYSWRAATASKSSQVFVCCYEYSVCMYISITSLCGFNGSDDIHVQRSKSNNIMYEFYGD